MILQGKGVSDGIAIGTLTAYSKASYISTPRDFTSAMKEISRFHLARLKVKAQLDEMRIIAEADHDETQAGIMNSYMVMLEDPEYIAAIGRQIKDELKCAEDAVIAVRDHFNSMFSSMGDPYMQARADDVMDIGNRVLTALSGRLVTGPVLHGNSILISNDLSPSETMGLDHDKLLAIVTKKGSYLSHTAILARSMGIPAVVGVEFPSDCDGRLAIVDGFKGEVIIAPDEKTLAEYRAKQAKNVADRESMSEMLDLPSVTADGKHIGLLANVGNLEDIEKALKNGAEGIGLFRTEVPYLDSDSYPTEEKQFKIYSSAVKLLEGRPLTIRTLDIGADKTPSYLNMPFESNPALGMRAIRYCLGHRDLFKTQLKAIYRAAALGPVSLLLPMVISVEEVKQTKLLIEEVKQELSKDLVPFGDCSIGVMIETPAAAIIADVIAREVDFFSIGTNDLTQYTLAVDRMNTNLEFICDYHHEAVLRLLRDIISKGHEGGCKVCLCGELAADTGFTKDLLQMGIDDLSVVPSRLPFVKKAIREMRFN
jgi:phosphotransferase system enzyme I (PtsI)